MNKNGELLVGIVDDDASFRQSCRRLVGTHGFRVEVFPSADAFLNSEQRRRTACLILDVRMPGVGGLELNRRLQESGEDIPTVFVSAHSSASEEAEAMQSGACAFLRKPFTEGALFNAIERALARARPEDKGRGGLH